MQRPGDWCTVFRCWEDGLVLMSLKYFEIIKTNIRLFICRWYFQSLRAKFSTLMFTWLWDSVLDGCFYVTSDGGSMWWIIDNRLRAANSAFMTDNKCALPNQANWSVPFWNGKRKRKGVHRQKLWYCVNTLLCITTMQNHCYELSQKSN